MTAQRAVCAALAVLCLGTSSGCSPDGGAREPAWAASGRIVMGTILEVRVSAADRDTATALVERAFETASHWEDVLTTWRPDGELARMNASAGAWFEASDELSAALESMLDLHEATDGAFDPSVGSLVETLREGGAPPKKAAYVPLAQALERDGSKWRAPAGVRLDAGGIGKGIALDEMAKAVAAEGRSWFFDFGGSSQLAHDPGGEGWNMAVAGWAHGSLLGTYRLVSGSLSTSRSSRPDNEGGTIVDPTSGEAVTGPVLATVWAKTATAAEAWSTALVARGGKSAVVQGIETLVETPEGVRTSPGFALTPAK